MVDCLFVNVDNLSTGLFPLDGIDFSKATFAEVLIHSRIGYD